MHAITINGYQVSPWLFVPLLYVLWVVVLFTVKKIIFSSLTKMKHAKGTTSDMLVDAVRALGFPVTLLIVISGLVVFEWFMPDAMDRGTMKSLALAIKGIVIIAAIVFLDRLLRSIIRVYGARVPVLAAGNALAQNIIRILVIGLGAMVLLDSLGISITPLIASLGISSLAVALALQPTLENVFAGLQIMADRSIVVGQFIQLASGEEGYVHKISWRATWIRMLANNVVVVPNKQLISDKILNYYYPEKEVSVKVDVGVHYDSDLEKVERVCMAVATETVKRVQGGVANFIPSVRFHTFNESSIDCSIVLRAQEFTDQYVLKHEFIKALHARFKTEGIVIPYPTRTIMTETGPGAQL